MPSFAPSYACSISLLSHSTVCVHVFACTCAGKAATGGASTDAPTGTAATTSNAAPAGGRVVAVAQLAGSKRPARDVNQDDEEEDGRPVEGGCRVSNLHWPLCFLVVVSQIPAEFSLLRLACFGSFCGKRNQSTALSLDGLMPLLT